MLLLWLGLLEGRSPRQGLADPSYSGTARPGVWVPTESARRKVAHRGSAGAVAPGNGQKRTRLRCVVDANVGS